MSYFKKGFCWLLIVALLLPVYAFAQEPPSQTSDEWLIGETGGEQGRHDRRANGSTANGSTEITSDVAIIHEERTEEAVAQGIALTQFVRFDTRGWLRGGIMTVDLQDGTVKTDLLTAGKVAKATPTREQVKKSGAIVGVNGDFFDIGNTNAALGGEVQSGELLKSGSKQWLQAAVTKDKLGAIGRMVLQGTVRAGEASHPLSGINHANVAADELVMFTPQWGDASRKHMKAGTGAYVEVLLQKGKVAKVIRGDVYDKPLTEEQSLLSGKGKAVSFLKALAVGDAVQIDYATDPQYTEMLFSVAGNVQLVKEGKIDTTDDGAAHPRTAVGFSRDGKKMFLVTVDGRQQDSRGMTYLELATLLRDEGAWTAINLDGGGSTTMVSRPLGEERIAVVNSPSDGTERPVPNGIGLWSEAKTGKLKGFRIEAPAERVFAGLSRTFRAHPYDTAYAPLELDAKKIKWDAKPGALGKFKENVFRAKRAGVGNVRARYGNVSTKQQVRVLGKPIALEIKPKQIGLEKGETETFLVTGKDEEGYSTFIEPRDIDLTYDRDIVDIQANADGSFTVTPRVERGATVVTATVGKLSTPLGITVGLETARVEGFEDASDPWTFFKVPDEVEGSLEYVDTPEGDGQAIKLSYDFTTSTRTRAVYAFPPGGLLDLPGDVKKIGVRVYGDEGNDHWLRARILDGADVYHTLDLALTVDWRGWKYVEADIPPGVQYPITLDRIYLVEPDMNKQDTGYILLDDVTIKTAQQLELPQVEKLEAPIVLKHGELPDRMWKFAVLNDLQLVHSNSDSKEVSNSIAAMQAVNETDVDFVILNGDIVDFDTTEQYEFAKKLIDENLKRPYYVIPGNHEAYGSGNLDNFKKYFGPDYQTFDHKGTRFILLNSTFAGFRVSNAAQWSMLRNGLKDAARNRRVKNVIVMAHHPLKDPLPDGGHTVDDQKEADLLESLLTQFRETSGKPAMMVSGHAHVVNIDQRDGIPYLVNGPLGKGTYGSRDDGGFYSYGIYGIDPRAKAKPVASAEDPAASVASETDAESPQDVNAYGEHGSVQQSEVRSDGEKSSLQQSKQQTKGSSHVGRATVQGNLEGNWKPWMLVDVRPVLLDVTLSKRTFKVQAKEQVAMTGIQAEGWHFPLKYPATLQYAASDKLLIKGQPTTPNQTAKKKAIATFDPDKQTIIFYRAGTVKLTVKTGDFAKTFVLKGKK